MDKTENFFGSNVGSENVFKNTGFDENKYETPEQVLADLEKLKSMKPSPEDQEFVKETIDRLQKLLKFMTENK